MLHRAGLLFISLITTQLYCAESEQSSKPNDHKLVALIKEIQEQDGIFSYDTRIIQTGYLTRQTDAPNAQSKSPKPTTSKTTIP